MEVNPKHSIMTELKKKASADKSDKTVKDLIWLLFDTSLLTSGFNLEEPTQFAGRIHRMIKLGLSIDDDDEGMDDDLPRWRKWRVPRMRPPRWRKWTEVFSSSFGTLQSCAPCSVCAKSALVQGTALRAPG